MRYRRLGEIMRRDGHLSDLQVAQALSKQKELKLPIGEVFVESGFVTRDIVWKAWQKQITHKAITLKEVSMPRHVVEHITRGVGNRHKVVPLYESDSRFTLLIRAIEDVAVIPLLQAENCEISMVVAGNRTVASTLRERFPEIPLVRCKRCDRTIETENCRVHFDRKTDSLVYTCEHCLTKNKLKRRQENK